MATQEELRGVTVKRLRELRVERGIPVQEEGLAGCSAR